MTTRRTLETNPALTPSQPPEPLQPPPEPQPLPEHLQPPGQHLQPAPTEQHLQEVWQPKQTLSYFFLVFFSQFEIFCLTVNDCIPIGVETKMPFLKFHINCNCQETFCQNREKFSFRKLFCVIYTTLSVFGKILRK